MNWKPAAITALGAFARSLGGAVLLSVVSGVVSCADADSGPPSHGSQAGGSSAGESAGEGGSLELSGGEGGGAGTSGGEGGREDQAGEGGTAGAAGSMHPGTGGFCSRDSDCNDGLFCNGKEVCNPLFQGADVKVCMSEARPCDPNPCDEAVQACLCADGDSDGDGYYVKGCSNGPVDCDDTDPSRNPGKVEVCDAEQHDEDCNDETFGFVDSDKDGFFDSNCANKLRYQPSDGSTSSQPLLNRGSDCDDSRFTVNPHAPETCNGMDDNCNGVPDEVYGGPGDPHTYYVDHDRDYWGSDENPLETLCNSAPPGYSVQHGDCDDDNSAINPGREEICDGLDNDCRNGIDLPEKSGDLLFGQPYDGVTKFECNGDGGWKVKTCPFPRLDCNAKYQDACETIGTSLCTCHACVTDCKFSCGNAGCEEIASLSTGYQHTCAIVRGGSSASGGTVACWGSNSYAQLGDLSKKSSVRANRVPDLENVTALVSGERHSCALDSGGQLYCWGNNEFGQLGSGPKPAESLPAPVVSPPTLLKPKALGAGSFHTCAIFDEGRLGCWGRGKYGQVGNNAEMDVANPVRVYRRVNGALTFINDASQVVAGYQHTCSLSGGRVECWGDNSSQQLGQDPSVVESASTALPVPGLEGTQVQALSASAFHTCALANGHVYCWGSNFDHELALESGDFAPPTEIQLPERVSAIATGSYFGCALSDTGTVYCWGSHDAGELGPDYNPSSIQPVAIPLLDVTGIFGGLGAHACAVTARRGTFCWGNNEHGELGNGQTSNSPQPVPSLVLSLTGSLSCGSN